MDVGHPYRAVTPTLEGSVLVTLAATNKPLTGREVARLTGRQAHSGVLDALGRLTEHGLVHREEAGRALLYKLNRDHLAAPAVEVLAGMRSELFRRLRELVVDWTHRAVHVSVFGSTARGDGDATSDVDLFVVRPDAVHAEDATWQRQLEELASAVRRWAGNHASVAEVSASTRHTRPASAAPTHRSAWPSSTSGRTNSPA